MRISIHGKSNKNIQPLMKGNGFTLLELSLVILVIGMLLSLALPNIGVHKAKIEKEREIEKISQTIKSLYDLSQVQTEEVFMSFDIEGNSIRSFSLNGEEREYLLPEQKLGSFLKIQDIITFEGEKIASGEVPIKFNPNGFIEPAVIHFADKDSNFYTLSINPLTGQSRVEKGYIEEE